MNRMRMQQQHQQMMMMPQGPMMSLSNMSSPPPYFGEMMPTPNTPPQSYEEVMPPPNMVTPQSSLMMSNGGFNTSFELPEPLPLADEARFARQESTDDFVNIFHSISLPSLEASLRAVNKKMRNCTKNAVF
jgi:hypothetical protein